MGNRAPKEGHHNRQYLDGVFEGEWKDYKPYKGTYVTKLGTFEGIWHHSNELEGKITFSVGSVFEGIATPGLRMIKGHLIAAHADISGEWDINFRFTGRGTKRYRGVKVEGEFRDGRFIKGKKIFPSGVIQEGNFYGTIGSTGDSTRARGRCSVTYNNRVELVDYVENTKKIISIKYNNGVVFLDNNNPNNTQLISHTNIEPSLNNLSNISDCLLKPEQDGKLKLVFTGEVASYINRTNDRKDDIHTGQRYPLKGYMQIDGIFRYEGTWLNGKLDGPGKYYDLLNGTYEDMMLVQGVRIRPKNQSTMDATEGEEGAA